MTQAPLNHSTVYAVEPYFGGPLDFDPAWINAPAGTYSYNGTGPAYPADMLTPIIDLTRILAQRAAPLRTPFQECYYVGQRWLVSDPVWHVLQALDPEGFEAVPAELRVREGVTPPSYWVATLTRFIDCFEELSTNIEK